MEISARRQRDELLYGCFIRIVLDGKAKDGKSMEAHKPQTADTYNTIENIGLNAVLLAEKGVVVGDGFEPSKA